MPKPFRVRRLGRETPGPRAWFVTVRFLEVAALMGSLAVLLQVWLTYKIASGQTYGPNGEPLPGAPPLLDRLAMMSGFGFATMVDGALVGTVLLLAAVGVLHHATPVEHARILRWEVAAVWCALALATVLVALPPVVGLVRGDPDEPPEGVVTYNPGPGYTVMQLASLPLPLVCAVLLALVALWWVRLPADFDEPEEVLGPAGTEGRAGTREPLPRDRDAEGLGPIVVDEVEQIEPVERLVPRERAPGDGATTNGYEDYFRRF